MKLRYKKIRLIKKEKNETYVPKNETTERY